MTTIIGNRGQLWTSTLSPHLLGPHLDIPEVRLSIHAPDPLPPWHDCLGISGEERLVFASYASYESLCLNR